MGINRIWIMVSLVLVLAASQALATDFYISPDGSDAYSGTSPDRPWRTIGRVNSSGFAPADVVHFRRDSTWTGYLIVKDSGAEGAPIVFRAYGSGEKPIIRNPGTWTYSMTIQADWVVVENFLLKDSQAAGILISTDSRHNVIQDCEFTQMGAAVEIKGSHNLVRGNRVYDMTMVVNNPGGDDDFGANGFLVKAPDNEFSYNSLTHCKAQSHDYGTDGGCFELHGETNGTYIHHNWCEESEGFVEISGSGENAGDIRMSYNVSLNNRGFATLHNSGNFAVAIDNLKTHNNTLVELLEKDRFQLVLIWFAGKTHPGTLDFRNNIVLLRQFAFVTNESCEHAYNVYSFLDGPTRISSEGGGMQETEIQSDPLFVNLEGNDFQLQGGSPAINAGVDLGYDSDFEGQPVPTGSAPDIGAFEYVIKFPSSVSGGGCFIDSVWGFKFE